jgi:hypothetical protein
MVWTRGLPPTDGIFDVRALRDVHCKFQNGAEWTWVAGGVRFARFGPGTYPMGAPAKGSLKVLGVGVVLLGDKAPIEWRPVFVPDAVPVGIDA